MGTEVMALREALVREATARVKAEAESATLRAARDRAEAVCKALCGPSGFARSAAIWLRGNDMPSAAAALESWAAGKGERPAVKCGECRHSLPSREATHFPLRCGLDTELYMGTEWTCPKGKPKPAPAPEPPKCKCGHCDLELDRRDAHGQWFTGPKDGLRRVCHACHDKWMAAEKKAARVAKLRERLESSSDDNAVKDTRGGGVAIVYYPLAVLDGRVRVRDNDGVMTWWNLADVTLLVPEGESHE